MLDMSSKIVRVGLASSLILICVVAGCAQTRIEPEWVYFPQESAQPRVVHIVSFNALDDIVSPEHSWANAFTGGPVSPFVARPAGIDYHASHLYICDTGRNIVHDWNLATGDARRLGLSGSATLQKPVDVAVDDSGNVFVADTSRRGIVQFDSSGAGQSLPSPTDGAFRPTAIAVSGQRLWATDIAAHAIHEFDVNSATWTTRIAKAGDADDALYYPSGVAVTSDHVLVADMMNSRVQVFDTAGHHVRQFGRPGNRYGDMGKPKHLDIAPDGVAIIADAEFARFHLFDKQGRLLMLLGKDGDRPGATPMPMGVAVARDLPENVTALVPDDFNPDYYVFVGNTVGLHRISLYAVGERR